MSDVKWVKVNEGTYESSDGQHLVEQKGDFWRISKKSGEDYDETEVYAEYSTAMEACAPDLPYYVDKQAPMINYMANARECYLYREKARKERAKKIRENPIYRYIPILGDIRVWWEERDTV